MASAGDALLPFLKALVSEVEAEASITTKLYNRAPDGTPKPYLLLTEFEDENNDTFERTGKTLWFEIHAVTTYMGDLEALELLKPVVAFLDRHGLTIGGWVHGYKIRHIHTAPSSIDTGNELVTTMAARFEAFVQEAA